MITFTEHIPGCCSGITVREYKCKSLKELLEKEKDNLEDDEHDFVWARDDGHTLMVSSISDECWYVIGYVKGINLKLHLPYFEKCYKKNEEKRLTKKVKSNYSFIDTHLASSKLGKLEKFEEEIGIDLLTLLRVLKYGIWVKENNCLTFISCNIDMFYKKPQLFYEIIDEDNKNRFILDVKEYGKTWSLIKEELL